MAKTEVALRNWPSTLQTFVTEHDDLVHDAQLDFFGARLATCSSDKSIKIFEVVNNDYNLLQILLDHKGPVWQVAWAHPSHGNLLASCSHDKSVIIWTEENGTWKNSFRHLVHRASVNSISWAPFQHGLILACGSADGTISVIRKCDDGSWNIMKIDNAHAIGCNAVSWEPAGNPSQVLKVHDADGCIKERQIKRFVSGGYDNLVKIWRMHDNDDDWEEYTQLEGHTGWVRDVSWAPTLGFATTMIASCSNDGQVIIWTSKFENNEVDEESDNEKKEKWSIRVLKVFSGIVWHVSWSRSGNVLAVSDSDYKVSLWKETLDSSWICFSEISRSLTAQHIKREAEKIAKKEAERIAKEEAERIAKEEAEKAAKEGTEGKTQKPTEQKDINVEESCQESEEPSTSKNNLKHGIVSEEEFDEFSDEFQSNQEDSQNNEETGAPVNEFRY